MGRPSVATRGRPAVVSSRQSLRRKNLPTKKNVSRRLKLAGVVYPTTEVDKIFCDEWLQHRDHMKAAAVSGMARSSQDHGGPAKKLKKFLPYLSQQLQHHERAVATEMVLEQKHIIAEMMAIGFSNPKDYYKTVEQVKNDGSVVIVSHVRKELHELTRAQAAAISEITWHKDGSVTYELPDVRAKHPYLKDLGQHLGLFHPKLIQEHRHLQLHAALDLRDIDTDKLEKFESMLIDALGPMGKQMLGIIEGESEEVMQPEE